MIPRNRNPGKYITRIEEALAKQWPPSKKNLSPPQFGLCLEMVKPSLFNKYIVATKPNQYLWTTKLLLLRKKDIKNGNME